MPPSKSQQLDSYRHRTAILIRYLVDFGVTKNHIARLLDVSYETVNSMLMQAGVEHYNKKGLSLSNQRHLRKIRHIERENA